MRLSAGPSCLAALGMLIAASCEHDPSPSSSSSPPPPVAQRQTLSQSQPLAARGPHWVQSQQLKAAMAQIAQLRASLPKDLPQDVESPNGRMVSLACASAATAADSLAATADRIPKALDGKQLGEADRRGFLATAQTLRDQAMTLREDAEKMQVERMQRGMDSITLTCIACHSRYRDLTGQVDINKSLLPTTSQGKPTR